MGFLPKLRKSSNIFIAACDSIGRPPDFDEASMICSGQLSCVDSLAESRVEDFGPSRNSCCRRANRWSLAEGDCPAKRGPVVENCSLKLAPKTMQMEP